MTIIKSITKCDITFRKVATKEITLQIPKGSAVLYWFTEGDNDCVRIQFDGKEKTMSICSAAKKLTGFTAAPSVNTMSKWIDDGIARSVTGKRVEPDGHGEDGSPSWLLVLGFI